MEIADILNFLPDVGGLLPIPGLGNTSLDEVGLVGVLYALLQFFLRHRNKTKRIAQEGQTEEYLQMPELLTPPKERAAYSDRMAYVLAELSALAYFRFEDEDDVLLENAKQALDLLGRSRLKLLGRGKEVEKVVADVLRESTAKLYTDQGKNKALFDEILTSREFKLVGDPISKGETQLFVCVRNEDDGSGYVVVSFRGTEKKVKDWLTDANAKPVVEKMNHYRIHSGFYQAYKLVEQDIQDRLNSPEAKDSSGNPLPVFITGHSLGGALALTMTRYMAANSAGACYTFGAPRVADYRFFERVKTPVYRVVNSSDIVPNVPLGALWSALVKLIGWLVKTLGPKLGKPIQSVLEKLHGSLDKLNGYRHFGDLRYLTDVKGGKFETVRLLRNPPALDRAAWFMKHLSDSLLLPLQNHGIKTYRTKLALIAERRLNIENESE